MNLLDNTVNLSDNSIMKTCKKCGIEKTLAEFSLHKSGKHGRNLRCKPCVCEINHIYYRENAEEISEKARAHRAENWGADERCLMNWLGELFHSITVKHGLVCVDRKDGSGGFIIPETEEDVIRTLLESADSERKDFPARPFMKVDI